MGLPDSMLGDTMEFGKSTTDRWEKEEALTMHEV